MTIVPLGGVELATFFFPVDNGNLDSLWLSGKCKGRNVILKLWYQFAEESEF
jgi:hypothetical protein